MIVKLELKCPECGSPVVKAGRPKINRRGDTKQMYVCTKCRRRTLNPVKEGRER